LNSESLANSGMPPVHRSLDLSFNGIRHIRDIDHLVKLTDLYFVSNKITVIENLSALVNITNLELGSNRIRVMTSTQLVLDMFCRQGETLHALTLLCFSYARSGN